MPITSVRDSLSTLRQGLPFSIAASPLRTAIAAIKGSFWDSTLAGMVAKGHGIEALCLFLDVLEVDLLARVVALNLYTPHNGAVRRTNRVRNAWQIGEIRQLIGLWELNLSTQYISTKLGRSPGAIRAKARWLGLPRRPRGSIISDYVDAPVKPTKKRRTRWDNDLSSQVIDRILAYQHYTAVALDLDLTPGQVRSKIQVLGLPKDRDRSLLIMDFRPNTPEAKALRARHVIRRCQEWGRVFVAERGQHPPFCPAFRKTEEFKSRSAMFSGH